jgi:benzylsuccinate CoA-transferase BbsF subunit
LRNIISIKRKRLYSVKLIKAKILEKKALQGIKVADFSWVATGPYTTLLLAVHGATVIRIESSTKIDVGRTFGPFKDKKIGINRSGGYAMFNNGKYGISLNLKHPKGIDIAKRLISWSDIVVENYTPGTMKNLGLSYDEIIKINPKVIMLSTCMQGQDGPRAEHPGYGGQLTSLCGFTHLCGWPDRTPTRPVSAYTDIIGPRYCAAAILAALIYRIRKGKGQHIDLSQFEAGLQFIAPAIMDYMVNGRIKNRDGNRHSSWCPHGAYPCKGKDKWCVIVVSTDQEWQNFVKVIGIPSLSQDARFNNFINRKKNEQVLDRIIEDWTKKLSSHEVMTKLQKAGVPAGIVQNTEELFADPQLNFRGHFKRVEHPEMGKYTAYMPAFRLSRTPTKIERHAPCIGEHNHYVYTEILKMSDEEFLENLNEGVFE